MLAWKYRKPGLLCVAVIACSPTSPASQQPMGPLASDTANTPAPNAPQAQSSALPTSSPAAPMPWPAQPDATWPKNCLIEDVGAHPARPWLTVACTDPNDEVGGALIVIDVDAGSLVSVSPVDNNAGWYGDGGLVLWNATGDRLASNVQTNAIGVFEQGQLVGINAPDEGRDNPVDYVWVDHRVYTDTGHFFDPKNGEPTGRFDFEPVDGVLWSIDTFQWVAGLNAVVGTAYPDRFKDPGLSLDHDAIQLVAYAPAQGRELYRVPIDGYIRRLHWSPSRRWAVAERLLSHPRSSQETVLDVYDTHLGQRAREVIVTGTQVRRIAVRDDGLIVTSSYSVHNAKKPSRTEVFAPDGSTQLLTKRLPWRNIAELGPDLAFSPDGRSLAILLDDASIAIFDLTSNAQRGSFPAPMAPSTKEEQAPRVSLHWTSPTRLTVIGEQLVHVWSTNGEAIASFVVPR